MIVGGHEPTVVVNFDVRCPARIAGVVTPIDLWADHPETAATFEAAGGRHSTSRAGGAAERRLRQAEYCIGAGNLNRRLSYLRPTKLRLVGSFGYVTQRMSSIDAAPAVAELIDWTMRNVYGHPYQPHRRLYPLDDVSMRLWQPKARPVGVAGSGDGPVERRP